MSDYTEPQLKSLQKINLDMAQAFVNFCEMNHITAYFCGGGCIGAIRHKGFIPWDDDLDFFIPRKDYEELLSLWELDDVSVRYRLSVSDKYYSDRNLFATIRDSQTTLVKPYQKDLDLPHGVALDVIPLDGYADGKWKRKFQCMWALIFSLFRAGTVPEKHGGIMAFGSQLLLGIFRGKKIRYKIWHHAQKKMTKYDIDQCEYITELCSGPFYMKKRYKAEWFKVAVFVPFENTMMPIPVGYDGYLKEAFGDYMQMPPKEKRVAHHDASFLDLENGYEQYKGIHFMERK